MHTSLEVITPAACLDLTVLETAKRELGISPSDTSQDEAVTALIKQASGIVADYCDMVFGAEEIQETFFSDYPGEWKRSFMLSREPVVSIDGVTVDGVLLDPSQYRMATDGHLHRLEPIIGWCHWHWTSEVVVDYTAGYVLLDALPYGVERAALTLIKQYHFAAGGDPSVRSEDIPGVRSVTYAVGSFAGSGGGASLPDDVVALLRPHRRLAFA